MLDLDLDCVDRLCVSVGAGCAHLVACLFAFCCGDYGGGFVLSLSCVGRSRSFRLSEIYLSLSVVLLLLCCCLRPW